MTQAYSDPDRESDPYSLPDVEVFYAEAGEIESDDPFAEGDDRFLPAGWYWWTCLPGCLPDSDPSGPFDTEAEALAAAQDE